MGLSPRWLGLQPEATSFRGQHSQPVILFIFAVLENGFVSPAMVIQRGRINLLQIFNEFQSQVLLKTSEDRDVFQMCLITVQIHAPNKLRHVQLSCDQKFRLTMGTLYEALKRLTLIRCCKVQKQSFQFEIVKSMLPTVASCYVQSVFYRGSFS